MTSGCRAQSFEATEDDIRAEFELVFLTLRLQLRSGARLAVFPYLVSPSVALRL